MNFCEISDLALKEAENWYENYNGENIVKDENSAIYGKIASFEMLYDTLEVTLVKRYVQLYYSKESKYYKKQELLDKLSCALIQLYEKFNDDGTDTLFVSNFHTPQQFGLQNLGFTGLVMKKYLDDKNEKEVKVFYEFCRTIEKSALGCLNSGFHTPNHRWVETSAMLLSYEVLKDTPYDKYCDDLMKKSKAYLAEGVDCDEYGEWSERSPGVYNRHCDHAFLWIYYVIKNEEYLDCVCKNLNLMKYYINPNDSIVFTQNSRRKDKGEVGTVQLFNKGSTYYGDYYAISYILAAYFKHDNELASIGYKLFKNTIKFLRPIDDTLFAIFFLFPELKNWEFDYIENVFPKTFEIYQPKSNILRKKTKIATYSYFAENPEFFQLETGDIKMKMRVCSSFFAVAQFIPEKLEKTQTGYKLIMKSHADYKLPLENPDGITTKDYWSIDYSKRKSIQNLELVTEVELEYISEDEFILHIKIDGCEKVPAKIELFFNTGLLCEIGQAVIQTTSGGLAYSRGDDIRIESPNGYVLELSGMFCNHTYVTNMRGSLDPIPDAFCFVSTGFTPIEKDIKIKISKTDRRRIYF